MLTLPLEYEVTRDRIFKMQLPESVEPGTHRFIVAIDPPEQDQRRKPGSAKGRLTLMEEDEEHLADFKDYLP